jgi:hypothetical protein
MEAVKTFTRFSDFYPYYLQEHRDSTCRRLHFIGTSLVVLILAFAVLSANWLLLWALPLAGYTFAWVGHFFFEKTVPPRSSIRFTACSAISSCTRTCSPARCRSDSPSAQDG